MSNSCDDSLTCPGGNCIGCRNTLIWCHDRRCAPFCAGCSIDKNHDFNANILFAIIVICLIAITFLVWFAYGPRLFEQHDDHDRANVIVPESTKFRVYY